MADSPVLSYHDSLLRQSDVSLLQPPNWLNDQVIGFSFDYFAREEFHGTDKIAFIEPAVTQMIKLCPEPYEIQGLLESLELSKKHLVIIAVNDNMSSDKAGGTHWTLLVWHAKTGAFYYYDSLNDHEATAARKTAHAMSASLGARIPINFTCVKVTQQNNNYDCGMHVLAIAHQIGLNYTHSQHENNYFLHSDSIDVKEFRQRLKKIIVSLAKLSNPKSPLLNETDDLEMSRAAFKESSESMIYEILTVPVEEFNLTTKMNRAAGFQYGKLESELGNIAARLEHTKQRDSEIEVLRNKLEELIVDLTEMESNVSRLDQYSKLLEDKVKKSLKNH